MTAKDKSLVTMPQTTPKGLQALQEIVAKQVGTNDLQAIVGKFVEKAKDGNIAAARFVVDYLLGAKYTPGTVIVNQFFDGERAPDQSVGHVNVPSTPYRQVTAYLTAAGAATPATISADTKLTVDEVVTVLQDHPERFAVRGNMYSLHS